MDTNERIVSDENKMNNHSFNNIRIKEQLPGTDDYWDLFATTGWNNEYNFSAADLAKAIANSWYAISAFDSGKLIGFGRVIADGLHHALIVDIIVHPEYQGIGIGTAILKGLLKRCKDEKIRDIQLFAAADKYGFYEKHGFRARPHNAPGMQYHEESSIDLRRGE